MSKKRRQDFWNERAAEANQVQGVVVEEFQEGVLQNPEGVSAEMIKFHLDRTTTPKVLPANKRD